jgi:nucleoside-diphosphate-sugar epimerase
VTIAIGVIGANGQVGSEVCLALRGWEHVRVVPVCRTRLGSALLRRAGLECRHGSIDSPESAAELIGDCQLVADFSLPAGRASEIRSATRRILENAILHGPSGSPFVYASTIMAFGMPAWSLDFRPRFLAHTSYGANKRYGERLARRLTSRAGRPSYVLRLSQVHGELQAASRLYRRQVHGQASAVSDAPSYTVFAPTIAEALVHIAEGREAPGAYTLVSSPPWTWREVHEYYCRREGIASDVQVGGTAPGAEGRLRSGARRMTLGLMRLALRHRDLLTGYLLPHLPAFEARMAAWHHRRRAGIEIRDLAATGETPQIFQGPIPGRQLRSLSDSRETLERRAEAVRELLRRAGWQAAPPSSQGVGS